MSDPQPTAQIRLGDTGLRRAGGYVLEEWLPELSGERGRRVIRQMSDQEPIIAGALFAVELLLRRVTWEVQPGGEEPADADAAAFVGECFAAMTPGWMATLPELLTFLPYGWVVLEIVYTRRADGRLGWEAWEPRSQDTLAGWEWGDGGRPAAMLQYRQSGGTARIPLPDKAIHLTTTSRKGNPEGRSILRGAYRSWYFKSRIENIEGVGIERDLAGLPVAKVPAALLSPQRTAEEAAVYNAIASIVTNIRRDTQEGVVWPLAYDASGNELYKLELLSTGGARQFDTGGIVQRYGSQIAMSMLADFLMLGHEQVGSFALSATKTELFTVALGAWIASISAAVQEQAFAPLLRLNGITAATPKLSASAIEKADLAELGAFLTSLTGAGAVLFPNDSLLAGLLREAGLPVDEAALAAAREERRANMPSFTPAQPNNPQDAAPNNGQEDGAADDTNEDANA